ncbi:MAG: LD-carboxypeptidase [Candidatus Marinimicrobia bacterium]|nr:LD-carboxypeptidase [Candidatus Neomarinimicrobiota bacterium]
MIKPNALKPHATIGIVSPSSWINESDLKTAVSAFEEKGYNIVLGESVFLKKDTYAGTPEQRANDMNGMFANPKIDAIICARGGYGANRVLPLLDYELIMTNPKIFMGYSDITAFLTSITQKTNLITFHGPMLTTFKNGVVNYNFELMEKTLSGDDGIIIQSPTNLPMKVLKSGKASGPLWGGNLCLLINRLGTPDQLNTDGIILFLEDIGEYLYAFDRMMVHAKEAGMFENINGLIMGELVDMKDQDTPFGKTTDEIVMDVCRNLDIPIISNFPCGHGKFQATMPISAHVELNATNQSPALTILESPVKEG